MVILSSSDPDVKLLNNISVVTILDDGDSKSYFTFLKVYEEVYVKI